MTGAAIIAATAMAGGTVTNTIAQNKMNKEMDKANREAMKASAEQKNTIKAAEAEAAKERKTLVDEQRIQLGAGLQLDGITSTRYKASSSPSVQTNVLG